MGFNNKIFLVDTEPVLNPETGKNSLVITRETAVYADRQEVGTNEVYSEAIDVEGAPFTYEETTEKIAAEIAEEAREKVEGQE